MAQEFTSRYTTSTLLGEGGMGEVYLAHDHFLDIDVALKLVRPEWSCDPQMQSRFFKEARALLLLNEPHIVTAYDFGLSPKHQLYLSMEYVSGLSLFDLQTKSMSLAMIREIISQLLLALSHAHARGVVHRDLKSENVIVSLQNEQLFVKLVDFGLAITPAKSLDDDNEIQAFGTAGYIAPEQILTERKAACPASDLYSVGVILYELVSKTVPFDDKSIDATLSAQLRGNINPITWRRHLMSQPASLRSQLETIIFKALSRNMWDRYMSADEFRRDLSALTLNSGIEDLEIMSELKKVPEAQKVRQPEPQEFMSKILAADAIDEIEESSSTVMCLSEDLLEMESDSIFGRCTCPCREKLWDDLEELAKETLAGHGCVVCLKGPFGVGKSYFLRKLAESWKQSNASVIQIDCPDMEYGDPQEGFRQSAGVFWNIIHGILGDGSYESHRERIENFVDAQQNPDMNYLQAMQLFMDRPALNPDTSLLPASVIMQDVDCLADRLFQAIKKTTFILIDDIQRCSKEVFDFLVYLKSHTHDQHVMIVAVYAPMEAHALYPERRTIQAKYKAFIDDAIEMGSLDVPEISRILRTNFGLAKSLSDRIGRHAWGNAYFAVTCVEQLKRDARLMQNPEGDLDLMPGDSSVLPLAKELKQFLKTRLYLIESLIGLISPLYHEVLLRVAILGHFVPMSELENFMNLEIDQALRNCWLEAIGAWCDYGILTLEQDEVRFTEPWHSRVMEHLSPVSKVRELHKRAARAYESSYTTPNSDQLSSLARHWEVAHERINFVKIASRAAIANEREGYLKHAQRLYHSLTKLWTQRALFPESEAIDRAINWQMIISRFGHNSLLLGDEYAVRTVSDWLHQKFSHTSTDAEIATDVFDALNHLIRGNYAEAQALSSHLLSLNNRLSSDTQRTARLTASTILIETNAPNLAEAPLELLFEECKSMDNHPAMASTAMLLSHLLWRTGKLTRANELDQIAYNAYKREGAILKMTELEGFRAYHACIMQPTKESIDMLNSFAECFIAYGDVWHEQMLFAIRFAMDILTLNHEHARQLIYRARKLHRDFPWMTMPSADGYNSLLEGLECLYEGLTFEARHAFEDAKSLLCGLNDFKLLGFVNSVRAMIAIDEGDESQAAQLLDSTRETMQNTPWFNIAYDLMGAMIFVQRRNFKEGRELALQAQSKALELNATGFASAAAFILVEAAVSQQDIEATREAANSYQPFYLPPLFKPIFEHISERIIDRAKRLSSEFLSIVSPLCPNFDQTNDEDTSISIDLERTKAISEPLVNPDDLMNLNL